MSSELEPQSAQSKIDSLQELNSKLLAEILSLERKMLRFEELEKKNKTDTSNLIAENAELRDRVTKLEQKQTQGDSVYVLEDSILHV
ncbi:1481_t:CDS:2 [Paraglomus occultum]|uniref:1481_t:CDS:1 n=1 Tax=Paraglomus occultum TaxID=144539 RepID=A0A9N8ZXT6_9GLOM|nr:1481_t:CDS:2 [Paraglomus occultum]